MNTTTPPKRDASYETTSHSRSLCTDTTGRPPLTPSLVRGVVDHPLTIENNNKYNNQTTLETKTPVRTKASSSAYAAALVQSAAKSILDTLNTTVSDDELSSDDDPIGTRTQKLPTPPRNFSPTLSSLQTKTLPALPEEQDRRSFLGCMAAILASAYNYDRYLDDENDAENIADSFAYLDGEDVEEYQGDGEGDSSLQPNSSCCEQIHDNGTAISDNSSSQPTDVQHQHPQSTPARQQKEMATPKTPGRSHRVSREQPRSNSSRRGRKIDISVLARDRHRRRRYELLSDFLLTAADLLMIDKSQAKAFLPMLTRLLAPGQSSSSQLTTSPIHNTNKNLQRSMRSTPPRNNRRTTTEFGTKGISTSGDKAATSTYVSPTASTYNNGYPKTDSPPASDIFESSVSETSGHSRNSRKSGRRDSLTWEFDEDESLRPFLEYLSLGSGFRCLSLLLLQHLLNSEKGYDSRIRHVLKKLGLIVLMNEIRNDPSSYLPDDETLTPLGRVKAFSNDDWVEIATRKFEALEHTIAWKLLHMYSERPQRPSKGPHKKDDEEKGIRGVSRRQLVRGLKIGSAGLVAGTIFAVTGGLAAPGIAAGVAAIAGGTAGVAAVVTLTSTTAITAIFGVGGGGLAAYKMHRRTNGLTEFQFRKESGVSHDENGRRVSLKGVEAELFSTICLSGWLRDEHDFQRPWGCQPTDPRLTDRLELLERFYTIYKPEYVTKCSKILQKWKGEERELWVYLKQKYGRDPNNLFPLENGPRRRYVLSHEQDETLDKMFHELGFIIAPLDEGGSTKEQEIPKVKKPAWKQRFNGQRYRQETRTSSESQISRACRSSGQSMHNRTDSLYSDVASSLVSSAELDSNTYSSALTSLSANREYGDDKDTDQNKIPPKHIATVWDYQSMYGGELYTVRWESRLLMELSDSVDDMALDMVGGATAQILKQTALSTLMSAVALPYVLVNAANMIDGTWTLMIERAEQAGKELARSLLFSRAGHRPVTLVGYSMGARVIYTCLKELALYQEKWEELQSETDGTHFGDNKKRSTKSGDEDLRSMREPAGIVEDAILMGTPNHLSLASWIACRQVVAGRLVNCFSRSDYILSLMFQFKRITGGWRPVCGTCPVQVHGVENVDVTDLVLGHTDYCLVTGDILKRIRHGQPLRNPQQSDAIVINH